MISKRSFEIHQDGFVLMFKKGAFVPAEIVKAANLIEKNLVEDNTPDAVKPSPKKDAKTRNRKV